ncbi:MAG: HAMP domain-containing histidine kinase [Clostridiales bacterium]|jgi:signal transduction histidine kinase|nr:HAMP domain-containing histidine kinase [Clostridiales bacterium]
MERNIRLSIFGISHDLRTPLTSLTGYLQLLSKEQDSGKRREYLEVISRSAEVLRDLTENFYELSRLELGETTFTPQSLNLERVVCEGFLNFFENFSQKGIEVEIRETGTAMIALADPVALNRILSNLAQNQLRCACGTVTVAFASEHGSASVTISNESSAPLPPDPERLFERFYTADSSRSNRGSGLGLYVSRKLAEGMAGSLAARFDEGWIALILQLLATR